MVIFPDTLIAVIVALSVDALAGDPQWLWRRITHPIVLFGRLVGALDRAWNKASDSFDKRRRAGLLALAAIIGTAGLTGALLEWMFSLSAFGPLLTGVVASVLIAQKSLYEHVWSVADQLGKNGIAGGREAVSHIVGRDPKYLDESGVARATIESLAENFSDAVVAPVFWFALFGLPGLVIYKAINTADSMIGYKSERHAAFGWASARLDDLVNFVPARLSMVFVALAALRSGGKSASAAFSSALGDASKHRSPNAGWPEAAFAGALGVALAGPRRYAHGLVDDEYINPGGKHVLERSDIDRALSLYTGASIVHGLIYVGLFYLVMLF